MSEHSKSKGKQPKGKHVVPKKFTMPKSFIQGSKPKPEKLSDKEKITHQSKYFIRKTKEQTPFYKTGPLFFGPGRMAYETDSLDSSSDGKADAEGLMNEYGESGIAATEYNKSKSSSNTTENAVNESNELLGRNIATGKGSGKLNRARRKLDKATMQSEGKSRLEVRQAKTKSKIADTRAQLQHLTESSGGKNQGKIDRLQAKLKVQTARDKSMTGRKAKREALKNYGK